MEQLTLKNKIFNDINEFENNQKQKGIDSVYNNASIIDFANGLESYFDSQFDDEEYANELFRELNIDKNIVEELYSFYINLRHSERYNYNDWDTLYDIIEMYIKEKNNETN